MLFILSTSLFVFLQTYFDSFRISLIAFGGIVLIVIVVGWARRGSVGLSRIPRQLIVLYLSFVVVSSAVWYKNYQYIARQGQIAAKFTATGSIIAVHGNGRYVFEDTIGREFLYYSSQNHMVGTKLFASATVEPGTGGVDIVDKFSRSAVHSKFRELGVTERGFNKPKWLLMKGRVGVMYERNAKIIGQTPLNTLDKMRGNLASRLAKSYKKHTSALTLGMLIGDRSGLSKEEYGSFVDSGLVHIIAVSGGNISLIVSFLSVLLFFIPYYVRLGVAALAVVVYAMLCGLDSSVIRATMMAILSILALFSGRLLSVWRSMGYVYVAMLLRNPYFLVYDLGFVFSFSALAGLVFFAERWSLQIHKKISCKGILDRFWNLYLLPSIAASLGIMAPLLFFTSRVNLLSILSNIIIIPVVPFVMIYGFFVTVLYSVISWQRITLPQERAVRRIYMVNQWGNNYALTIATQTGEARIVILLVAIVSVCVYIIYKQK